MGWVEAVNRVNKHLRVAILLGVDSLMAVLAVTGAFLLRFEGRIPFQYADQLLRVVAVFVVLRMAAFFIGGMYRRLWRYASIGELFTIVLLVTLGSVFSVLGIWLTFGSLAIPRSIFVLEWILAIGLVGGTRIGWRVFRDHVLSPGARYKGNPVLIVGAGDAGVMAVRELQNHYHGTVHVVGFVDDDPNKQGAKVLGYDVLGTREHIVRICREHQVGEIVIAIPSAARQDIRDIVERCQETDAKTKILPGVYDLIEGNVSVSPIREVEVEDLLGREPVRVDLEGMSQYLTDQVVLVTGAGGSIGSELCRQIVRFSPQLILLLDACENNVYEIDMELRNQVPEQEIYPLVKDVKDREGIAAVFRRFKPDVVFHAAAHKHVPMMEANPEEAIKNNVMGTINVAQAAKAFSSSKFVLISTDKAVNPTSVMGASKRIAEMFIQFLDQSSATNFVAVRFGNVLGSKGSVIPLFKRQIANGGPVTVTDEKMVRYFMTIPEAVQLVIQAGTMAQGGEIFVLDMGEPVKIMDLARSLIKFSGFEPNRDIPIQVTGMRPGEKLFEELMLDEEGIGSTTHERIYVAKPCELNADQLQRTMEDFASGAVPCNQDDTEIWIRQFIPEFRPHAEEETEEEGKAPFPASSPQPASW